MRARAMRASPQYAAYMMQTDAERAIAERSHPSAVAKSFSAIQQFMADKQRVDKAMLNQQYNSSFRAPQSLESFEQGRPQLKQPSPLEQWRMRLGAMMESGNPVLQKQAISEMQAQSKQESTPATSTTSDAVKQYEYAVGQGYNGTFAQWKKDNKGAGTTVNVNGAAEKPYSISDLKNIKYLDEFGGGEVLPGTYPSEVKGKVGLRNAVSGESSGKLAMMNTSQNEFPLIDELLYKSDGKIDNFLVTSMYAIENIPITAAILKTDAGRLQAAFENGMQAITRTETGAAMNIDEIANVKRRFMPRPWDKEEVQQQKVKAFKFFINNATELLDPLRRGNQGLTPVEITDKAVNTLLNKAADKSINIPKKGDVVNGMEFIGTNPNNKDHWRKK